MLIIALALQVAAYPLRDLAGDGLAVTAALAVSYLLLILGFAANSRYWFARVLVAAAILNAVAMGVNGWRMPVSPESLVRIGIAESTGAALEIEPPSPKSAVVELGQTRLAPITDSVVLSWPSPNVVSPGDVVALAGILIAVPELWRVRSRSERTERAAARQSRSLWRPPLVACSRPPRTGIRIVKVLPCPTSLAAVSSPPCA